MLKFLNIFKSEEAPAQIETMRARFERVTAELNDVLSELEELPPIQIDPAMRQMQFTAPDQFSDEALALPKPSDTETAPSEAAQDVQTDSTDAGNGDQKSAA